MGWRELFGIVALAVWVGGAALVALAQLVRVWRVRRVLAGAWPAPPWLEKRVGELSAALGVRPPRVRVLDGLASPLVWGLGRARLLWPLGLEDGLTPEGVDAVLVHELAHLRRRDHWVGWLLLAGGCVWWWHPLFRLARRRLGCEAELACDAWVVATLPEARRAYAEALIEVCQRGSWAAAAAPAWGAAGSRRDFERRLVMVMRERVPCRLSARMLLGVGLLAVLALPAWTLGQAVAPPSATPAAAPADKGTAVAPLAGPDDVPPLAGAPDVTRKARPDDPTGKAVSKPSDRDRRLQELEKKVEALLRELKELRGAGKKEVAIPIPTYGTVVEHRPVTKYTVVTLPAVVTLSRAIYALPAGKAEALAKFLKEHVKSSVLEVAVVKGNLVVTTTLEDQQTIRRFVDLVQGKRAKVTKPDTKPNWFDDSGKR